MPDRIYMLKSTWQSILDALRSKTKTSASYTAGDVPGLIAGIITGGYDIGKNVATQTVPVFEEGTTVIANPARVATTLNLPATTQRIKDRTFVSSTTLTSIPNINDFEDLVIEDRAFSAANNLVIPELAIPGSPTLGEGAFFGTTINKINLPNATFGERCFQATKGVTEATIGYTSRYLFYGSDVQKATILKATELDNYTFSMAQKLELVDIKCPTTIKASVFEYTDKLTTLILRSPTLVPLGNYNAFGASAMLDAGSKIYVPQALLSQYPTETNWSSLKRVSWLPIEGSPYEE